MDATPMVVIVPVGYSALIFRSNEEIAEAAAIHRGKHVADDLEPAAIPSEQ